MVARVSSNRTSDSGSRSATAHGRLRAGKNAPAAVLRAPSARPRRRKSRLSCPFGVPQVIRGAQGITPPRQAKIVVNLTSVPCLQDKEAFSGGSFRATLSLALSGRKRRCAPRSLTTRDGREPISKEPHACRTPSRLAWEKCLGGKRGRRAVGGSFDPSGNPRRDRRRKVISGRQGGCGQLARHKSLNIATVFTCERVGVIFGMTLQEDREVFLFQDEHVDAALTRARERDIALGGKFTFV